MTRVSLTPAPSEAGMPRSVWTTARGVVARLAAVFMVGPKWWQKTANQATTSGLRGRNQPALLGERHPGGFGGAPRGKADREAISHRGARRDIGERVRVISAARRHADVLLATAVERVVHVGPGRIVD